MGYLGGDALLPTSLGIGKSRPAAKAGSLAADFTFAPVRAVLGRPPGGGQGLLGAHQVGDSPAGFGGSVGDAARRPPSNLGPPTTVAGNSSPPSVSCRELTWTEVQVRGKEARGGGWI